MIPFEYFYTITIRSEYILPKMQSVFMSEIPGISLALYEVVFNLWIIGAVIKLLILFLRQHKLVSYVNKLPISTYAPMLHHILKSKNVNRNIDLVEVSVNTSPAIVSLRRPIIIIPSNIPEDELYYILSHEVEHYKHHDLYFITFLHVLCAVNWWNPLLYFFKRLTVHLLELRVDMVTTENFSEEEKLNYLQCILNTARRNANTAYNPKIVSILEFNNYSKIKSRFDYIIGMRNKEIGRILPYIALLLLFISTLFIVEPYYIAKDIAISTFVIPEANSYFVQKDNSYDLYINDEYQFSVNSVNNFDSIPVYTPKEVEK